MFNMKKQNLNEQLSRIKEMMGLNEMFDKPAPGESSYERFMDRYSVELHNAVKKLRQVTPDMLDSLSEEQMMKLEEVMNNYDENVQISIEHMVNNNEVFKDSIAKLAIENSDRMGTEPQMVIYAIDDYTAFFGIHDEEEDDEPTDIPGFEGTWDQLNNLKIR